MIEQVLTGPIARGNGQFEIVASHASGERQALVSADTATCAECLHELFNPANRRYLYPFINCTNCGPRFTIVRTSLTIGPTRPWHHSPCAAIANGSTRIPTTAVFTPSRLAARHVVPR